MKRQDRPQGLVDRVAVTQSRVVERVVVGQPCELISERDRSRRVVVAVGAVFVAVALELPGVSGAW